MMVQTREQRTESRAISQLGVSFRLHGRLPDIALDCIGLAGHAAEFPVPSDYALRGDFEPRISAFLEQVGFAACEPNTPEAAGNIVLAQTAPNQLHIMIAVQGGFVHAHAGLRRVVLMPVPGPWPILRRWQDRRI
jgi:murein DD-endopeptidase / murein LD-carboxypeptidase